MKVEQFYAKNQFHLYGEGAHELQSYDSLVVKITGNSYANQTIVLGRDWDYSTTTSKYVYLFLEEYADIVFYGISNKRAYIRKLIENGTIKYDSELR
jgi:hypothetical protein